MIKIFETFGGYVEINEPRKGCWVNITHPTSGEIQKLTGEFGLPGDIITDILDQDERPRIEFEDDWTLIIMRIPVESTNNGVPRNNFVQHTLYEVIRYTEDQEARTKVGSSEGSTEMGIFDIKNNKTVSYNFV